MSASFGTEIYKISTNVKIGVYTIVTEIFKQSQSLPHSPYLSSKLKYMYLYQQCINVVFTTLRVFYLQFDGSLLATGSYDGYARLWSTDGKIINKLLSSVY